MFTQNYDPMRYYPFIFLLPSFLLADCDKAHEINQSSVISPETSNPFQASASSKTAYINAEPRSFVKAGLVATQASTQQVHASGKVKFCLQKMPKLGALVTDRSTSRVQNGNEVRGGAAL